MSNRPRLLIFGICSLILAFLVWLILQLFRVSMIVGFGIIATNTIDRVLVLFFVLIGVASVFVSLFPKVQYFITSFNRNRLKKISLSYRAKSSGPEEIREQLKIMKLERPKLAKEINNCLKLLDRIDSEFERFDQLIDSNEATYISTAREGLEEIEQILCGNLKKVINRSIIVDDDNSVALDVFYDQYRGEITSIIEKSNGLLDKGDDLLIDIVDSINRKGSDGITIQLDSWRQVIRSLDSNDSIKGDEEK